MAETNIGQKAKNNKTKKRPIYRHEQYISRPLIGISHGYKKIFLHSRFTV